jgi:hypothetical protein
VSAARVETLKAELATVEAELKAERAAAKQLSRVHA